MQRQPLRCRQTCRCAQHSDSAAKAHAPCHQRYNDAIAEEWRSWLSIRGTARRCAMRAGVAYASCAWRSRRERRSRIQWLRGLRARLTPR
jgi:hypothetical protein